MNRRGRVFFKELEAGVISENEDGYAFQYDPVYIANPDASPVSLTLPLRSEPYSNRSMLPFFDGLIPEGWLLLVATETWKINSRDRMGLLLACCKDCIGAVCVLPFEGALDG